MNWNVQTVKQPSPRIEKPCLELPNFGHCNRTHSLPRGMEHSRRLLAQLATKLTGLIWRVRDLSGTVRLAYFNARWQSFVTLTAAELFAYIGSLWSVDYVDGTLQGRIYGYLVSDDSRLPFGRAQDAPGLIGGEGLG
jgi:hypothetical protein